VSNNVIKEIANNDLCIGCGICKPICPTKNIDIDFNENGLYQAFEKNNCIEGCNLCLKVCPFAFEDSPTGELLGNYKNLYSGYVCDDKFRLNSTSGGLASFLIHSLLKNKQVDYAIHIVNNDDSEKLFKFSVAKSPEEFKNTAKSAYYPVELSEVIEYIMNNDGSYVITALPCFVKAIRSAQNINKKLKNKIKFVFGLTCGQLKSKHFLTFLARLNGLPQGKIIKKIDFRTKDPDFCSGNFYFNVNYGDSEFLKIYFSDKIGFYWSNRYFTPKACNYCDDVFADMADISFMDAWLPEFMEDWKGTNLVISRNSELSALLENLKNNNKIKIDPISEEKILKSQQNVIEFKRGKNKKRNIFSNLILQLQEKLRLKSFEYQRELIYNNSIPNEIKKIEVQLKLLKKIYYKLLKWSGNAKS